MYNGGKTFLVMLCKCVIECVMLCFVKVFLWPCCMCYRHSVTSLSVRHEAETLVTAQCV